MEEYLHFLKAYVEGAVSQNEWLEWREANAAAVRARTSRKCYLRLKHQSMRQARAILEDHGIGYQADKTKCHLCGTSLFVALPGKTTIEECTCIRGG